MGPIDFDFRFPLILVLIVGLCIGFGVGKCSAEEKVFWTDTKICFPEPRPEPPPKVPDSPYDKKEELAYWTSDSLAVVGFADDNVCIEMGLRPDGVLVWRNVEDEDD